MAAVQAGMFTPGNQSPRAYAPQTPTVALAALWLTTGGAEFRDVEEDLQSSQMSSRYAAAFGMALAAEAGVDPSAYPAWRVRGEIFGSLQHPPLRDWYRGCC